VLWQNFVIIIIFLKNIFCSALISAHFANSGNYWQRQHCRST